jgi:hypothetical protein
MIATAGVGYDPKSGYDAALRYVRSWATPDYRTAKKDRAVGALDARPVEHPSPPIAINGAGFRRSVADTTPPQSCLMLIVIIP